MHTPDFEIHPTGLIRHNDGPIDGRILMFHPRERRQRYPWSPPFTLNDPRWASEQRQLAALLAAGAWNEAFCFVESQGFWISPSDIPDPDQRAGFTAWLRRTHDQHTVSEIVRGFWS